MIELAGSISTGRLTRNTEGTNLWSLPLASKAGQKMKRNRTLRIWRRARPNLYRNRSRRNLISRRLTLCPAIRTKSLCLWMGRKTRTKCSSKWLARLWMTRSKWEILRVLGETVHSWICHSMIHRGRVHKRSSTTCSETSRRSVTVLSRCPQFRRSRRAKMKKSVERSSKDGVLKRLKRWESRSRESLRQMSQGNMTWTHKTRMNRTNWRIWKLPHPKRSRWKRKNELEDRILLNFQISLWSEIIKAMAGWPMKGQPKDCQNTPIRIPTPRALKRKRSTKLWLFRQKRIGTHHWNWRRAESHNSEKKWKR